MTCTYILYDTLVGAIGRKSFAVGLVVLGIIFVLDVFHSGGLSFLFKTSWKQWVSFCRHLSCFVIALFSSGLSPSGPAADFS